ncbi:MAG TPA: HWE histidine kinase domain-containing protein [Allosphingosinicella sp.]|nr:HWE histidine kinase domain-containing protein [Allosphingosinicella sp.]
MLGQMLQAGQKSLTLESLQPLLDTALDAVVVMRRDGTVAAWNDIAKAAFGWSASEAVGRPMVDLIIPAQHREAHCQGLERYNRTGEERVLNRRIEITAIDKNRREFPIELSITTAPIADEVVFVGFLRDISKRRETEARLERQAREAQLLFDVTRLAADTGSFEAALKACLEAISHITGWPVGHALILQRNELVSTSVWHEEIENSAAALKEATARLKFTPGVGLPGIVLETGEPAWISDADEDPNFPRKGRGFGAAFGFPIKSEGRIIAVLEFFAHGKAQPDPELMLTVRTLGEQVGRVLERKRTEEHQRLLINELNHRVKNTLAIVQSVAAQTFKGEAADPAAKQAFESRLGALAAAHDVLTAENWESASLDEVVRKTGLGCGADGGRIQVEGPDVRLAPRTAVFLSMALHELCTNAVKYGSLSNASGTVAVSWDVLETPGGEELRLQWQEMGGPPVVPPSARGFGTRMIERGLASELGGTVRLEFMPKGLRCLVVAPLPPVPQATVPASASP